MLSDKDVELRDCLSQNVVTTGQYCLRSVPPANYVHQSGAAVVRSPLRINNAVELSVRKALLTHLNLWEDSLQRCFEKVDSSQ